MYLAKMAPKLTRLIFRPPEVKMFQQALRRLAPLGNAIVCQSQRNFGVSAVAQKNLDPIQQLFVDKIREYKSKSAGGKLVDATAESEASLKDMLGNLERAYGAKGVDMKQFPAFNFSDPELVWPGLNAEQEQKVKESIDAEAEAERLAEQQQEEEDKFDYFEGHR